MRVSTLFLLAACVPPDETVPPGDLTSVQATLSTSCTEGCHSGDEPSGELDLTSEAACSELMNVPSSQHEDWTRLVPGDAQDSLLICKIDPNCALPEGSSRMPLGDEPLNERIVASITGWVNDGAPGCPLPDTTPPTFGGPTEAVGLAEAIEVFWEPAIDDSSTSDTIVYDVFTSATPGGQSLSEPDFSTQPGATSAVITGLASDQTRYVRVRAVDEAGNRDENQMEVSATTLHIEDETAPTFDGLQTATPVGTTSIELGWAPASDDVTPEDELVYAVYGAIASGEQDLLPNLLTDPGATSVVVSGLAPGVTYYVVVRARDTSGNEDDNTVELSVTTNEDLSFADDVEPIFEATCTGSGCHSGQTPKADLDLSTGTAWSETVNVSSTQCNNRLRVNPGKPDTSYLYDKILGVDLCFGNQMPKQGSLTAAEIQIIRDWIADGALDN